MRYTKSKQTKDQYWARRGLLQIIKIRPLENLGGITVEAPDSLIDDPGADHLDALLCAIRAAWARLLKDKNFTIDRTEGWIAYPGLKCG